MTLHISKEQARHLLRAYHLRQRDLPRVMRDLGSVQYDPLNPLGRNPDLVFQARVQGYQVDDWQRHAYTDRLMYDAWDKQACLVPICQWAMRTPIRSHYLAWHDRTVLDEHPDAVDAALTELDSRGPLSSLEFENRSRIQDGNSWYGPTVVKRILRALWLRGVLVTHHREAGRHYYDRAERVIPKEHLGARSPTLPEYHRWIVLQRHRAAGLLRRSADAAIWSATGDASIRLQAINTLVEASELTPVRIEQGSSLFHMPSEALELLDEPPPTPRLVFLAPLDNMLWDRASVRRIFNFDYAWEVYKPLKQRTWGYYVIPVFYGDRFVGRLDSRLEGSVWRIARWWWEEDVDPDSELLEALSDAAGRFMHYLRAETVHVEEGIEDRVREAVTVA